MDALTVRQTSGESRTNTAAAQRLCELLSKRGVPPDAFDEWRTAEDGAAAAPASLLNRLRESGHVSESDYVETLATLTGSAVHGAIDPVDIDPEFTRRIPIAFARSHRLIGLRPGNGRSILVTSRLRDPAIFDYVAAVLNTPARVEYAAHAVVDAAINAGYAQRESDFSPLLQGADTLLELDNGVGALDTDLLDHGTRAPVIRLVHMILLEAAKRGASDVHVQPAAAQVKIRYRIDGVLYEHLEIPPHMLDEVISRIKVIGGMDIAEKRLAQDGRTTVTLGDKSIDLRISVIPTCHGERAVLRLLDKSTRLYTLQDLGLSADDRLAFESLIRRSHGIILVTGPTGAGKSTTLYAALQYLDCTERNILTLEDPIEYQLPGISQTQVARKKGMTFATGLRAVLRQDPDVIMVGEIRDEETARMAVQSSLTGHLVFSTLHTNDAAGAVSRLLDLGIEPFLAASSLLGSMAQRLIRMVCPACARDVRLTEGECRSLGLDRELAGRPVKSAAGCDLCAGTGYRGRKGVFELLTVDEPIRELIVHRAKSSEIERAAVAGGMTTLLSDAVCKLLEGTTTVEEVSRVTQGDAKRVRHSDTTLPKEAAVS